jgi:hypothetical protein
MSTLRVATLAAVAAAGLSGCYVVPVAPDGAVVTGAVAIPGAYAVAPAPGGAAAGYGAPPVTTLAARLYPANEIAAQSGLLAGTVVMPASGKGRFQLDYRGELLVGEATRVASNARAGIANAVGERGTAMSCTYTMSSPWQGTGTCSLSTGARYQVHLGG